MKTIMIGHCSRGRPQQSLKIYNQILASSSGKNRINYFLSLDSDDPKLSGYKDIYSVLEEERGLDAPTILVNSNRHVVDATNRFFVPEVLKLHDILIIPMDDIYFPDNWDEDIIKIFDEVGYNKILKTKNQWQGDMEMIQIAIGGIQFFLDQGYIFHPAYYSMYADNDLTEWAKRNDRYVIATHLVFPHIHYIVSTPQEYIQKYGAPLPPDDTYARENSSTAWDVGKAVWEKRKENGFNNAVPI